MRRQDYVGFAVVAAAILGSSSAWTAQGNLPDAILKNIAKINSIAVLTTFKDELTVAAPKDVCTEVEELGGWDFKKQVEEHAARALSARFMVSTKAFEDWAARRVHIMGGRAPKNTLPPGGDVDAFLILTGDVGFRHSAGLPTPDMAGPMGGLIPALLSTLTTTDDPEIEYVSVGAEIVETKTKARRTIAQLVRRAPFNYTRDGLIDFNRPQWKVVGPGAKMRTDKADWLCGNPLTEERRQELRDDYRMLIEDALNEVFRTLTLTDEPQQVPPQPN